MNDQAPPGSHPLAPGLVSTRIDRSAAQIAHSARPTGRIAEIEVLRAFAVLLVVVQHVPQNLVFWHSRLLDDVTGPFQGWVGVDLFFAISGFVIARSLLPTLLRCADTDQFVIETVRFWLRRAWRLFPSAWLWLAIPILLCLCFNRSGVFLTLRPNADALVAGMLDVANFRFARTFGSSAYGVTFPYWSLSLEEQFYLVLPVAAFLFRRWIALPLLLMLLLQFEPVTTPLHMTLRTGAVCAGVLLALWEGSRTYRLMAPRGLARHRAARVAAVGVPLLFMTMLGSDQTVIVSFRLGLIALLSAFLVWAASYGRGFVWREGWSRRRLLWVAERSYALYLIHIPVYLSAHEIWFRLHRSGDPHGWVACVYVASALLALFLLAEANDRLFANRLRRYGAFVAARFGQQS